MITLNPQNKQFIEDQKLIHEQQQLIDELRKQRDYWFDNYQDTIIRLQKSK